MHTSTQTVSPARPVLLIAGAALLLALATVWLTAHLGEFGQNIGSPNIIGDYLNGWVCAVVCWLLLAALPLAERPALLLAWSVKVAVTLGIMLLYEQHYGLDAFWYFRYATMNFSVARILSQDVGTGIYELAFAVEKITGPSYHAMKVVFSFAGLWGGFFTYRGLRHFLPNAGIFYLYIICLLPTDLFWSSVLGKDPITFLGVGLYVLGVCGWLATKQQRYGYVWLVAGGIMLASWMRGWFTVIMVPPVLLGWIACLPRRWKAAAAAVSAAMFLAVAVPFIQTYIHGGLSQLPAAAMNEVNGFAASGNSSTAAISLRSNREMLEFWPLGVFTALFRPLPEDVRNIYMAASAAECLVMLGFAFQAARYLRPQTLRDPLMAWAVAYVGSWTAIYGFISYGNLGAAARFRLQVMPVFLLLLLATGTRAGRRMLQQAAQLRP